MPTGAFRAVAPGSGDMPQWRLCNNYVKKERLGSSSRLTEFLRDGLYEFTLERIRSVGFRGCPRGYTAR